MSQPPLPQRTEPGAAVTDFPIVEARSDTARRLADLLGVQNDLLFVVDACKRLQELFKSPEQDQDPTAIRSYWTSALVAYVRSFGTGVRDTGLDPSVFEELPGEGVGAHQYFKDSRDKHVAHSVNAFEQVAVGFNLSPDSTLVEGVSTLLMFKASDDIDGVSTLQRLAAHALTWVERRTAVLRQQVIAEGKAIDAESLQRLPRLRLYARGNVRERR